MSEAPRLYTSKPKKAQLKQAQEQPKGKGSVSSTPTPLPPSASASFYKMGSGSSGLLPHPPKESFARRYKFLLPLLLTSNLAIGAYFFTRTKEKDTSITEEEGPKDAPSTPVVTAAASTATAS